jgi:hypothetical protein
VRTFNTVEDVRQALLEFRKTYNTPRSASDTASSRPAPYASNSFHLRPSPRRLISGCLTNRGRSSVPIPPAAVGRVIAEPTIAVLREAASLAEAAGHVAAWPTARAKRSPNREPAH